MNKLFTKIATLSVGLAMAIGVGVAVSDNSKDSVVQAAGGSFNKITSISDLTSGEKYLIVSETDNLAFDGSLSTIDAISNKKSVTISNNSITTTTDFYFTITSKSGGYSIKGSGNKYIGSTGGNNNELQSSTTDSYTNTITWDSTNSCFIIRGSNSYLVYNGTSGQTRFRYYKPSTCNNGVGTGSYHKLSLFKEAAAAKTLSSIAVSSNHRTFAVDDTFIKETVTATYSDSTTADVTSSATFSGYNMASAGNYTVSVSYTEGGVTKNTSYSITVKSLSSIAVTTAPTKTTYNEGDSFDSTGMVVTATYSDASTADVTSSCTFTPDPLTVETTAVTVSYGGQTTTQAVTVNEKHGTATNPYTVAEAYAAIASGEGITNVYVAGIVSNIVTAYSSQYNNISFDISSDGTTTGDQFRVYRCKSGNVTISSDSDVLVDDEIVAFGNLTTYGDIKELAEGCTLYSRNRKTISSLTVTDNSGKNWFAEDVVSTSDLQVVVNYSNGSSETITDGTGVTITSGATLSQGSNTVNISFTNIYGTETGSVSITASAVAVLNSVTISGTAIADKGLSWDLSGLTVTGTSQGGSAGDMGDITSDCVLTSSSSTATPGNTTITVHVNYKTGTKEFDVTDVAATINNVETYTDTIDRTLTGRPESTSYDSWSGKKDSSDAIYAGNSAGDHDSIQLRSSNNAGVVSTASGGDLKSVTINYNSNTSGTRTVSVYGKTTAYSSAADLYSESTRGTLIGEVNVDNGASQTINVPSNDDYQYVGIRSKSGALYLDSIVIVWKNEVQTKTLDSLSVTTNPTKTTYAAGQLLDLTGLVVTASYKEEGVDDAQTTAFTTSPAEGYQFTDADGLAGTKEITITSTENENISASFNVTVTPKIPTALNRTTTASWTDSQTLAEGTGRWKAVFSDASEQTNIKIGDSGTTLKIGGVAVDPSSLAKNYSGQEATLEFTAQNTTVSNTFTVAVALELSVDSFEGAPDYVLSGETSDLITANFTSLKGEPDSYSVVSSNASKLSVSFDDALVHYNSTSHTGILYFTVTGGNTQGQYIVTVSVTLGVRTESKSLSIVVMSEEPTPSGVQYQRVTSLDDVTTGNYVIAAYVGTTYYALPSVSTGKLDATTVTVTNGIITEEDAGLLPLEITKDNSGDYAVGESGYYFDLTGSGTDFVRSSSAIYYDLVVNDGVFKINPDGRGLVYRTGSTNKWGKYSNGNINGTEYYGFCLFKEVSSAAEKTSFDWVKEFVDGYMYMNTISQDDKGSGACKGENGYYLTAKRAWNTMVTEYDGSDNLETVFETSFNDAYLRYIAWADACGDAAPFTGTTIQSAMALDLVNVGNSAAIIAIVSVVSVVAIGGYFFLRKKKED